MRDIGARLLACRLPREIGEHVAVHNVQRRVGIGAGCEQVDVVHEAFFGGAHRVQSVRDRAEIRRGLHCGDLLFGQLG